MDGVLYPVATVSQIKELIHQEAKLTPVAGSALKGF